jgi:hypothetical protein
LQSLEGHQASVGHHGEQRRRQPTEKLEVFSLIGPCRGSEYLERPVHLSHALADDLLNS